MPFEVMDQRSVSVSSHLYQDIPFSSERQGGLHKLKTLPDHQAGSMFDPSLPSKVFLPIGSQSVNYFNSPQSALGINGGVNNVSKLWSDMPARPISQSLVGSKTAMNGVQHESSLFSSSLSDIFARKLRLLKSDFVSHQSSNNIASQHEEEPFESLEEMEAKTIGNLLPDENDLFSGLTDGRSNNVHANRGDEFEDFDLFSSGGGMELEGDDQGGCNGPLVGEHPYGEHPSRTLFVRNINSNVEDLELKDLFEQYGDIRTLYTACKHRGFVMISYYDIRAAQKAISALQSMPLRRRKLDIHYSIPKENLSDKDFNQGTLEVYNVDSSVSTDELTKIFGSYGEIKEVREAPNSIRNKLIEFYDLRAAEAALHALTASEIGGKQFKLAAGYPGGARKGFGQGSELEQAEYNIGHNPSNNLSILRPGMANESNLGLNSAIRSPSNAFMGNGLSHLSSSVPRTLSSPMGMVSTDNNFCLLDSNHSLNEINFGNQYVPDFHPHSLPEYHDSLARGINSNNNGVTGNGSLRLADGSDRRHTPEMNTNGHLMELNGGAFGTSGNGNAGVRGHHYVLNNSNSYQQHPPSPMMWQNSPSYINGPHAHRLSQMSGFPWSPHHMMNGTSPVRHHVGYAPAVNASLWERHAFSGQSPDTCSLHIGSPSFPCFPSSPQLHPMEVPSRNIFSLVGGNGSDMNTSTRQHSSQEIHLIGGRNLMMSMPTSFGSPKERGRHLSHRRSESNSHNNDRKQYELDLDCILRGDDNRTTLMIKNIPNKYTSKMLLAVIDESCRGIYDFIYLPIDFKNKCNVGYAFINMVDPKQIVPFYKAFNGKKWEKFNSEKVATLAYARIQGKAALIAHFQNSSLMNEDKSCRPILFHTDGPNAGDPEPFPMGTHIRSRPGRSRTSGYEESHTLWSPSSSANGEESS